VTAETRAIVKTAFRSALPMWRRAQTAGWVAIDLALGIHTTGKYQKPTSAATGARPCGWTQIAKVFHRQALGPDDVVLDVGSGAGRLVLYCATRFACRKVIGVELDDELDSLARRNLSTSRLRPRTPIELVHGDVLEFDVPDDVTVVLFFNPFEGETLEELIAKLAASVDRRPRRMLFIYKNPRAAEMLAEHPRFVLVDQMCWWRPDPEWARSSSVNVYEVVQQIDLEAVANDRPGHTATTTRASDPVPKATNPTG
jgi:SAM-dependent methyltransferase